MLYLNMSGAETLSGLQNLTLTSVVFELPLDIPMFLCWLKFNFNKCCIWILVPAKKYIRLHDLTLTSVVFELLWEYIQGQTLNKFNFNKCCIWMIIYRNITKITLPNLTLTSVVFELVVPPQASKPVAI